MKTSRALLVSLPWAEYQCPNLSIGYLSSYAKRKGFAVDALHLHLDFAASLGIKDYEAVCESGTGEVLGAALLFPECRKKLLRHSSSCLHDSARLLARIERELRRIYRRINWQGYELIGFTVNYQQLFLSLLIASWIKRDFPEKKIVLGGSPVAGALGKSVLECFSQIDFCVDGEGEIAFTSLLKVLRRQHPGFGKQVPGLIYRSRGQVLINQRKQLPKLEKALDPDYEHYFRVLNKHPLLANREVWPYLPIEVARGCPHRCAFCADRSFFQGYRALPPRDVALFIRKLSSKYRCNMIVLGALMLTEGYLNRLAPLIKKLHVDLKLICAVRAGMSKDALKRILEAGICEVEIGFESFSSTLLRKMNKHVRLIDNIETMKFCEEIGMRHHGNLIIDYPSATQSDIDKTTAAIEFVAAYQPVSKLVQFSLLEGSDTDMRPAQFDIMEKCRAPAFARLLPKGIADNIRLWEKDFTARRRTNNYTQLRRLWAKWNDSYFAGLQSCRPLLSYYDLGSFLQIRDFRNTEKSIELEGWVKDLYLFCDSIRSFKEIRKRFPKVPEKELGKVLRRLFKLKVMYTEDDDWLSLAIHASPENRRHMPFL